MSSAHARCFRNLAWGAACVVLAACTRDAGKPALTHADSLKIAAVRAESASASSVAARPALGLWDIDHVSERLVRSGVAPRRITPAPAVPAFFASATASAAFSVGRDGELRVFTFRDSVARKAVTDGLDSTTASPRGAATAWPRAPLLIIVQNLAAVMLGGTDRLRERVQLALEAGLAQQ